MATLAADIEVIFDPRYDIGLTQHAPVGADTYFRGGVAYSVGASGLATLTPAVTADLFLGVVMEHAVVTTASLVWIATSGVFRFANTSFTNANRGKAFAMPAAALFDNPGDLLVSATGAAAVAGQLKTVDATALTGYLNTNVRIADENL